MVNFLGLDYGIWTIIISSVTVMVMIIIGIFQLKKKEGKYNSSNFLNIINTFQLIYNEVPNALNPKQRPIVPDKDRSTFQEASINLNIRLGNEWFGQGQIDVALAYLETASMQTDLLNFSKLKCDCLKNMGLIYLNSGYFLLRRVFDPIDFLVFYLESG